MKRFFSLFGMLALAAASSLAMISPAPAAPLGHSVDVFRHQHFDMASTPIALSSADHFVTGLDRLHLASFREASASPSVSGASQRLDLVNLPRHLTSMRLTGHDPAAASPTFFRRE